MADPKTSPPLTRASVISARSLINPYIHRTPVLRCHTLDDIASTPRTEAELRGTPWEGRTAAKPKIRLWFKCENLQRIGAFKARGAFHAVERLKMEGAEGWSFEKGVVTHSSGNHAQALALAARTNGIPAYIVMPEISAPLKIAATRGYGATVIFSGSTQPEREAVTAKVIAETGARLVPPYDHPDIILGQGTLGIELQEQVADMMAEGQSKDSSTAQSKKTKLDAVIAPCGGGGMLSGVALSCENTGIRVFGAEPSFQGADDCRRGFEQGSRVEAVSTLTIADGLRTPVGKIPWSVIYERRLVRDMYAVSEDDIRRALRLVLERMKVVVEPSAVVGLAALLFNEDLRAVVEKEGGEEGWDVGVVFSGGNLNLEAVGELVKGM